MKQHPYISVEKISLEEFLKRMTQINPKKIRNRKGNWIRLINANKLTCPVTSQVVTYCSLDKHKWNESLHYNFYSKDHVMFTIDHILPISRGGNTTALENIQPMIDIHNFEKGSRTDLGY